MTKSETLKHFARKTSSSHSGRPRNEFSHTAILNACLRLLVEVGYDNMSIEKIASLAKVGKATIYRYWSNKAEIVVEAVLYSSAKCENCSTPYLSGSNLRENMINAVNELCKAIVNTDGAIVSGLIRAMQEDTNLALLVRENIIEVSMQPITQVIEHGIQNKDISGAIDFSFLYSVILSVIFTRQIIIRESLDQEFATYLVDYIVLPLITYHTGKTEITLTDK